ncbi:Cysteine-rich receptor-like protein kinase 29 [Bienertia sinuspersici]
MELPNAYLQQKEANGNRPIFGVKELIPNCSQHFQYQTPESGAPNFMKKLIVLFHTLKNKASIVVSNYKFSNGYENSGFVLSDCFDCLQAGIVHLKSCCSDASGAKIHMPSCDVQFENYSFDKRTSQPAVPPSSSSPSGHAKQQTWKRMGKSQNMDHCRCCFFRFVYATCSGRVFLFRRNEKDT